MAAEQFFAWGARSHSAEKCNRRRDKFENFSENIKYLSVFTGFATGFTSPCMVRHYRLKFHDKKPAHQSIESHWGDPFWFVVGRIRGLRARHHWNCSVSPRRIVRIPLSWAYSVHGLHCIELGELKKSRNLVHGRRKVKMESSKHLPINTLLILWLILCSHGKTMEQSSSQLFSR